MNHFLSRKALLLRALGSATALSALVSLAVVPAQGDTPVANSSKPGSDVAVAGAVIAKDAKTGELRAPTAKEMRQLAKAQARDAAARGGTKRPKPPEVTVLRNGAVVTTLDPSYDVYSVASRGADGKIYTACVPGNKVESVLAAAQNGNLTKKEILDEK